MNAVAVRATAAAILPNLERNGLRRIAKTFAAAIEIKPDV
jgi:hypothetical protein